MQPRMRNDFPIAIPNPAQFMRRLDPKTSLAAGGMWGTLRSGQSVVAADGTRFIWSADGQTVIYSISNRFYGQNAAGFLGDIRTAPAPIGARRAVFMAKVAEVEMKLLMGIAAGASSVGFAAVVGTEILGFAIENRDNFTKWIDQFIAVLRARRMLKNIAPVLYDKLFNAVLAQIWRDYRREFPEAITHEVVAFGIGVIIGTLGKKIASGKFTLLGVLFVVFEQLAIRSLSITPDVLKLSRDRYATELVAKLRQSGITIDEKEILQILDEIKRHPEEVRQALEVMRQAFQAEAATRHQ